MSSESELDGTTWFPHINGYPADAGEFAALWNSMTDGGRDDFLRRLIRNSETSLRCIIEGHMPEEAK